MTAIQVQREANKNKYEVDSRNAASNERNAETNRRAQHSQDKRNRVQNRKDTVATASNVISDLVINPIQKSKANAVGAVGALAKLIPVLTAVNDPRWYAKDTGRAKDIASIPWGDMYGIEVQLFHSNETNHDVTEYIDTTDPNVKTTIANKFAAPSVCTFVSAHTIGRCGTINDEVNRAANRNFDIINRNNGRIGDYEPADLLMYQLAVSDLHAYLAHIKRAYCALRMYSPENAYYPRVIVEHLGYNFDDLLAHIYDIKGHINWLIDILRSIPMIPNFSIGARWIYEYTYVFQQINAHKSQSYMYIPAHFYKLNLIDGATTLVAKRYVGYRGPQAAGDTNRSTMPSYTFEQMMDYTTDLVNGILGMQDARIMRADIEKAFGSDSFVQIPYVSDTDALQFVTDELSLLQFKNAVCYGIPLEPDYNSLNSSTFTVRQNNGLVYSDPNLSNEVRGNLYFDNHLLVSTKADNTCDDVLEYTRLIPAMSGANKLAGFCHSLIVDIIFTTSQYWAGGNTLYDYGDIHAQTIQIISDANNASSAGLAVVALANALRQFDYAPAMFVYVKRVTEANGYKTTSLGGGAIMDWDYFATISDSRIEQMNKTIALNMLGAME